MERKIIKNGLELVERLNELSLDMERLFDSKKGKELNERENKEVENIETIIHEIKRTIVENGIKEVFEEYVNSLQAMQDLTNKVDELPRGVYDRTMDIAHMRYIIAKKELIETKLVFIEM